MNILISTSYSGTLSFPTGQVGAHSVVTQPRDCDWGLSGRSKDLHLILQTLRLLHQARRFDVLVLCTVGLEAFLAGRLHRLLCRRTSLVVFDLLLPKQSRRTSWLPGWLCGINHFACIRTGDIETLEQLFSIPRANCSFIPFPARIPTLLPITDDEGYIYSAGWAHRDWKTLCQALATLPYEALLSAGVPLSLPEGVSSHIKSLPMQSPEEGRRLMANARLVVLSMKDTYLPSGPLVLLDAMAMGKAVVATHVNGTRDYITDGKTGLLVPPDDPRAMADIIQHLMENPSLRTRIGDEARRVVGTQYTLEKTLLGILHLCQEAIVSASGRNGIK